MILTNKFQNHKWPKSTICMFVGCIEDLCRFSGISAISQLAGDNQSLKFKWRDWESNPGPLAPQAKSFTTRPPPFLTYVCKQFSWLNMYFGCFYFLGTHTNYHWKHFDISLDYIKLTNLPSPHFSHKSIAVAADESLVTWGPSPTYGELVSIGHSDV